MKTSQGLVEYAKRALSEKWGYVWGTYGKLLTEELLDQKIKQYPDMVGKFQNMIRKLWMGRRVTDCVGLIKGYLFFTDTDGDNQLDIGEKLAYDGQTDVSANGMYNNAKEKGAIDSMPDITGLCVYKKGHIGVYIGKGQVIEAHKTSVGVIQTPLKGEGSTPWTHWLKCPYISYETPVQKTKQELAVEAAFGLGIITDKAYWLEVLQGKKPVNLDYLTQAFLNTEKIKGGK